MSQMSRRKFIGSSTAAVIVAGTMAKGKVFGANERIRMCVIGFHSRGRHHIKEWNESPDSEVAALCDVDEHVLDSGIRSVEHVTGKKPKRYTDMRDVMADKDVDAVSIATPNNWHTLAAVWAMQAGKDVYVEKPCSHEIWEGRQLVEAAKKYNRIVQHGTQSRSDRTWMRDIKLMHDGFLGKLHMAKGFTYKTGNRHSIGFAPPEPPPDYLHWDLWQGPAKRQQYCKNYVHYNWHWFWIYGNGETGNQGVHQMDLAVWGLNKGFPVRVYSSGGRYDWNDQGQTPNTQVTTFTYGDGTTMVFEVRNLGSYKEAGSLTTGNTYWGEKGYYVQGQGFFDMDHKPIEIPKDVELPPSDGAFQNFLNAVKSRKHSDIHGDVTAAHLAAGHCHLANTAYRLGRSLEFDPAAERYKNDDEANKYLRRSYTKGFEVPEIA